jgi:hypothetical protein
MVDNSGGNSNLNLWSPVCDTYWGEIMSLSQWWYIGGSATSEQTANVGWQICPQMNGREDSRLFIYWTPDGNNAIGCYNLGSPAFLQVTNSRILGGGLNHDSTEGGPQYEFSARYYLYRGFCCLQFKERGSGIMWVPFIAVASSLILALPPSKECWVKWDGNTCPAI